MSSTRLAAVASVVVVLGACGGDAPAETVLVSRVEQEVVQQQCEGRGTMFECTVTTPEHRFETADGSEVVAAPSDYRWLTEPTRDAEVRCAGATYSPTGGSTTWTSADGQPLELAWNDLYQPETAVLLSVTDRPNTRSYRFADGGEVELSADAGIYLESENCYDERGRWRGTAGSFEGRDGRYHYAHNSLQGELTLVDGAGVP